MKRTKKEYLEMKYKLSLKELTMADIARKFDCTHEMVRHSLMGTRTSKLGASIRAYAEDKISDL